MSARPGSLAGRHLLVVGTWDMREAALRSWAQAGIEVTLVDHSASSRPGPVARRVELDVWDSASPSRRALAELAEHADGVVTLAEFCAATAAAVADRAGLPGPGIDAARIARDKLALRRRLAAEGIPGPRFAAARTAADIRAFFAAGATDAVLKPADSAGSTAVFHVRSEEEAIAALPSALRWSFSGEAILEEFIAGAEFSVEAVVRNGITHVAGIVEKATLPDCFVEYRHIIAGDMPAGDRRELRTATADVVGALGVRDAVIHAEFRRDGARFVLIEIAVRPAGGLIPDLLRLATGFDLYRAQAAVALGLDPEPPLAPDAGCAGVQFVTCTGTVEREPVTEQLLRDHPEVACAGRLVPVGTVIDRLDTNGVRAGYVIARAPDRETLERVLDQASAELADSLGLSGARVKVAAQ